MAEVYKRLGAVDVAAATYTVLYTVPTGKAAVVSSINVCNRSSNKIVFRIAHVDNGGISDLVNADFIYFNISVSGPDAYEITRGITMAEGDSLIVRSDKIDVNFMAWGSEVDLA